LWTSFASRRLSSHADQNWVEAIQSVRQVIALDAFGKPVVSYYDGRGERDA